MMRRRILARLLPALFLESASAKIRAMPCGTRPVVGACRDWGAAWGAGAGAWLAPWASTGLARATCGCAATCA